MIYRACNHIVCSLICGCCGDRERVFSESFSPSVTFVCLFFQSTCRVIAHHHLPEQHGVRHRVSISDILNFYGSGWDSLRNINVLGFSQDWRKDRLEDFSAGSHRWLNKKIDHSTFLCLVFSANIWNQEIACVLQIRECLVVQHA